ncbi:MAG: acyl-CoA dehydrogenase family protein [Bdellovibrionota bacterium]
MDFSFTPEQEAFRSSIREFMRKECPPEYARRLDEQEEYPFDLYEKMAKLGWLGLPFPEKYGGLAGSPVDVAILVEELARGMLAAAQVYGAVIYVGGPVNKIGSEKQREKFLPPIIQGKLQLALGLTEPGSGSDAAALRTKAVRQGDVYFLKGSKIFCSRAHIADYILIAARTDPEAPKHKGISLFMVPKKQKGVQVNLIKKLGVKAIGTCEVVFDDAEVPAENLIGEENKGWEHLTQCLALERFYMAAMCTGGTAAVLDLASKYAKEREQFGKPIGSFQAIQHKLADMYMDLEASRLLTYQCAWLASRGKAGGLEGSAAKVFASEAYMRAAHQGMQIMGGYGYMMEFDMQRHFRDAKLMEIGGGTSEIHRTIMGSKLGGA